MNATAPASSPSLVQPILVSLRRIDKPLALEVRPAAPERTADLIDRSFEDPERWDGMA
jgi:hypothetical protein